MGIMIKNASLAMLNVDDTISSMENAVIAINSCLEESETNKEDISYLINIGLYNDQNLYEPGYATLIQMKSGINLDPDLRAGTVKKTFSFDLTSGTTGFLNAVNVLDSVLKNDEKAVIVSSNNHPSEEKKENFPFSRMGTAVLVEKKNESRGFRDFFNVIDFDDNGMAGYVDIYNHGAEGRRNIAFTVPAGYHDRLCDFTIEKINEYVSLHSIDTAKTKLFISQPTGDFVEKITAGTGFPGDSILRVYEEYGDAHSSIVGLLFSAAKTNGFFKPGDKLMVVTAGSGLTVAISMYDAE